MHDLIARAVQVGNPVISKKREEGSEMENGVYHDYDRK